MEQSIDSRVDTASHGVCGSLPSDFWHVGHSTEETFSTFLTFTTLCESPSTRHSLHQVWALDARGRALLPLISPFSPTSLVSATGLMAAPEA